jgi:hypothetical protein
VILSRVREAFGFGRVAALGVFALAAYLMMAGSARYAEPITATVRDVLIDPYRVDARRVRLFGRLHRSELGDGLYWPDDDTPPLVQSWGVAVEYSSPEEQVEEPDGTYVGLEGIFLVNRPPRRGPHADDQYKAQPFNGALVAARRITLPQRQVEGGH